MFGTLPYDSPLPNQVKLNYPLIQQARQITVNRTIKHHKINKQRHPVPSRETIRRGLTEVGLRSRRPLRRLPLTPHHRQCRLDFADLGQLGV
ncbi:hypothetical protein TNCV_4201601 [Trichonephila clavipes]|uniref:Transposase Tc1-like domain-containing protein n=1 Tax=Trichonephila clavipes TaxID=2585209 RepID=A0A8X6WBB8_TRICX|nr:hypothetical protein TNCV_4201601 [Trichonephila clavipes]